MIENLTIAIFCLIGGAFLDHFFAAARDKSKLRREKGQSLISAIKPQLDALRQTGEDCRLILTPEAYKLHEAAIQEFLPYLSRIDKSRLQKAWDDLVTDEIKKQSVCFTDYDQYADCGSLAKRRQARPIVIKKIERILSIARK